MKCHDCSKDIKPGQKFCDNCGRDLRPRAQQKKHREASGEGHPHFAPAFEKFAAKRQGRKNSWFWVFTGIGIVALAALTVLGGLIAGIPVCLFFIAFGWVAKASPVRMTEAEYRKLPGTADGNGKHVCGHCGHKGIYVHGEYRSALKFSDCSSCGKNLFVS